MGGGVHTDLKRFLKSNLNYQGGLTSTFVIVTGNRLADTDSLLHLWHKLPEIVLSLLFGVYFVAFKILDSEEYEPLQ